MSDVRWCHRAIAGALLVGGLLAFGCPPVGDGAAHTCSDGKKNGDEVDVDCGGSCPHACAPPSEGCSADSDCATGFCAPDTHACATPSCTDGYRNNDEVDVDCGGSCALCGDGTACVDASVCSSGFCTPDTHVCATPSCSDGYANGDEVDVDCGGSCAALCGDGTACVDASVCSSGFCTPDTHVCATPSCSDSYANEDETDVDCGGNCTPCVDAQHCLAPDDCASGYCQPSALVCAPDACHDLVQTAGESDVDCGGPCGASCTVSQSCGVDVDCVSGFCRPSDATCQDPTCSDTFLNQNETGTDCGGVCLNTCAVDVRCATDDDCISGFCRPSDETCQTPSCSDNFLNQDETGTDCGGVCLNTCAVDATCASDDDCVSGFCRPTDLTCQTPTCGDGFQNNDELGVDCRGTGCPDTCADGEGCVDDVDCTSGFCRLTDDTCQTPTCGDGFQNQDETDVDCGGLACGATCAPGQTCNGPADCASSDCAGTCVSNIVTVTYESSPDRGGTDHTWGHYTVAVTTSAGTTTFCNTTLEETAQYTIGTEITVTAHAEVGFFPFDGWTVTPGGTGAQDACACSITLELTEDTTVAGTFPLGHTLCGGRPACP